MKVFPKVTAIAGVVLAAMIAAPASAATVGVTVDAIGSATGVGLLATGGEASIGDGAVKYFIPLTTGSTCTYGVDCGTASDSGTGGTVISMFMMFSPVQTAIDSILNIEFDDLDLIGVNDPTGFFETIEILDGGGSSLTGLITSFSSLLVTGDGGGNDPQFLSLNLGVLGSGPLWLELQFTADSRGGTNTPEYLIATVTAVPLPAGGGLLFLGLFGLGLAAWRQKKTAAA